MSRQINREIEALLEETSRSFFLTLKVLPSKVRAQIGLLYLLARIADTIADSDEGDAGQRLHVLTLYNQRVQGQSQSLPDFESLANIQKNPSERKLLLNVEVAVKGLERFSSSDQNRIKDCLDIIISGQSLDLERFGSSKEITPLANEEELDDYAYRVAGSVGEFWTHISLDHLFKMDDSKKKIFFANGIRFGKALQLINILRDIPEDLRLGRCYIPNDYLAEFNLLASELMDPSKMYEFRPLFDNLIDIAAAHLDAAVEYIEMLPYRQFRLRAACMLPVLIGQRTLTLLRSQNVLDANERIKVLRPEIKRLRKRTMFALPSKRRSHKLLLTNRDA